MVYYFTSNVEDHDGVIYMGKDKFENEELIKFGVEEDVWVGTTFHVDKLSSAHVYYRLPPGGNWQSISQKLLDDLAQLTKANSIEGNKKDNITIIYTPWSNLKKGGDMAVGQVSFHNPQIVKRVFVKERINAIVNRLNKTKEERYPDLNQLKVDFNKKKLSKTKSPINQKRQEEYKQNVDKYRKEQEELKSYSALFNENMKTNQYQGDVDPYDSDDGFM